ncbi:MAG: DUF1905 domain-containing protein [Candidatus Levybacteria bacterium]|nr:DUF1905 domain-containing protein [Candidatus Levybacteria bacterium]
MSAIRFEAKLFKIGSWTILRLPKNASTMLPSRALTMIKGTINGFVFRVALEPDGRGSHWFRVDEEMLKEAHVQADDSVSFEVEPTKEWVEPDVPEDFKKALTGSPKAHTLWMDITPNARWDWIRWIRAVKTPQTRQKHIEVALSKLNKGIRRPCCFNRNLCSEPYVSKNWVLLTPMQ